MKKIIIAAVVVCTLIAAWMVLRGEHYPITNAKPTGTNIIAFGDSLTAGYGAGVGESYPDQLARKLGVPILNAGVSGDTTQSALLRLQRDVLDRDPRIVIVCLGANDYLRKRNIDLAFADLETIVKRIQARGALVILVAVQLPLSKYPQRYHELAVRTGSAFVPDLLDGILSHPELMADEVHPNARGYAIVADRIEPVVKRYLRTSE